MDLSQYQFAKNFLFHELQALLQLHLDDITLSKLLYMFWTGVEVTAKDGKISNIYPVGPILDWLIEMVNQEKSPYQKIPGGENPLVKLRFTGKSVTHLLQRAEHSPIAWEAAKNLASKILEQGDKLPQELREFVIKALKNNGPLIKRGQDPIKKIHRDCCIIMLLTEFERIGFLPVTKSSSSSDTLSLCDAVVEAFRQLDKPISYDAVKSIWDRRKKLRKNIPLFRLSIEKNGVVYIGYSIGRS